MNTKNNLSLAHRLAKIAISVGRAESRLTVAREDLEPVAEHVPAVAEALRYLEPAARLLEPLFDELHKIIHDPACAGITLSTGAEGQVPSTHVHATAEESPTASTALKPETLPSFGELFASVLAAAPEPDSEPDSELEPECSMFQQVADLTEQVSTLQDDVKMLVEICRSQQNQLKMLSEAVFADANFFNRKVANGN